MKQRSLIVAMAAVAGLGVSVPLPAVAQDEETVDPDTVTDTIIVTGGRRSRGMSAFIAGDYATAEVEFAKNARCALRRERNQVAALDQIQQNQATQAASAGGAANGAGGQQGATAAPPPPQPGFQAPAQRQETPRDDRLDCGERGFQVYMKGLSQLQLGKLDEAKASFRQAGNLDRTLYDAQYRLGLIAILEGNEAEARRRLRAVSSILRRCRRCEDRDEIVARREHLEAALRGDVPRGG